ncbi:hypothetical protein CRM22_000877 [Opisthorchis felineus]|nr:hypothetical protein CRM22_000877 [Opisthorchis felineus]
MDTSKLENPGVDGIIQIHPDSQAVTLNSTVRLQCRVRILTDPQTGAGAQVYWSKNDFGIGGSREDIQEYGRSSRYPYSRYDLPYNLKDGQYDLQITNVELSDEGSYVCQVNFMKHQYLSQTALLTVQVPSEAPKLYQVTNEGKGPEVEIGSATPAIVDDGAILVLKCVARHGKPGAIISWSIDGVPIQVETDPVKKVNVFRAGFTGNLTNSLTPSPSFPRLKDASSQMSARLNKLHHGKLVECRATNLGYDEQALRPAFTKLEVHYAPVVSIQVRPPRRDNEYMEHDIITVECAAHGRPDSFMWEWFVNGRQVENIADPWYRLRLTRDMHNAVFRCIAISNKKGHTETTVRVKFGPQFLEPSPLLFTASVGEDIAMECPARGNPTPRIDWRREGGHEVLHRGVTYRKDSLRDDDFGTYICTAYVSEFPPVSKQMYISKRRPPTIQPNPVVHAKLGRTARLRCTVNSVPQPPPDQTHWYFNGRPVRQDNHHTFEREEFLGGVVLILQIAHVMRTDYGKYNCTVRNGYGSDWKLIELSQQEDIPLQFIVGSAIAVGILIVVGLIILCACRQRICGGKYTKGRQNQNSSTSMRPVQAPFSEYGVINSEFKAPLSSQNGSYRSSYSPWYPNATVQPQTSYIGCGSDTDEQRSLTKGPKFSQEKYFYDDSKIDTCPSPNMPIGISSAYCPNMSSCQLIQPLCNGGGYISTIDARFLPTTQPTYITGCPTFISGAAMVGATNQPDFIPETISLQPLDSLGGGCLFTTADGHQVTTVPQIATLDLTNGMPHHLTTPSIYSGDAASGTSSVDHQVQSYMNHSKGELSDNARSPSHSGSGSMQFRQQTVNLPSSITLGVQPELHGISYVINDHTTNV